MAKTFTSSWEPVDKAGTSERLWVPDGWLVRTTAFDYSDTNIPIRGVALCFVPDERHRWSL